MRFMWIAENYVYDGNKISDGEQYKKKMWKVFSSAHFGSGRTFKNSFVLLSVGGKKSKTLSAVWGVLLFFVESGKGGTGSEHAFCST